MEVGVEGESSSSASSSGCRARDAGSSRAQGARRRAQDAGHRAQGAGRRAQSAGRYAAAAAAGLVVAEKAVGGVMKAVAVGDINTSGLLLFTTDGELANSLMHPSSQIEREYAVRVMGDVTPAMVEQMHAGLIIDGNLCRFTDIQHYGGEGINQWYHVVLMEGRNREVRKLWESQGLKVSRLKRVRFGPIFIPSTVSRGKYQELPKVEVDKLLKSVRN